MARLGLVLVFAFAVGPVPIARAQADGWRWLVPPPAPLAMPAWPPHPASAVTIPAGAPFTPVSAVRTRAGRVVLLGANGELAVWRADRRRMAERPGPGGATGIFLEPAPGWERIDTARGGPRRPVALGLRGGSVLIAGRDGDVARVEQTDTNDGTAAIVRFSYPRAIALVRARDASLFAIFADRIVRTSDGGMRRLALGAAALDLLGTVEPGSASRFLAVPIGAHGALVAYRQKALLVERNRVFPIGDAQNGEIWALVPRDGERWIGLTHIGRVLAGEGAAWRISGSIEGVAGPEVPHPVGAFRGADGRVRLVDYQRAFLCVGATADRLEPCGAPFTLARRAVHPLDDGLVVETQSITTNVVDDRGPREIPGPGGHSALFAGSAAAPCAAVGSAILRFRGGAWSPLFGLPDGCNVQALAVAPAFVYVACEGGAVAARALPP